MLNQKHKDTYKEDNISHFICRLLYCHDSSNHQKFIEMEREILRIKLLRQKSKGEGEGLMNLLKNILSVFLAKTP